MDKIRHLVRRTDPLEYFPGSDATTVNNRVLPLALPSIWNCVASLSANGTIQLDTNYMKSADLTVEDLIIFLKGCDLNLVSTDPIQIKDSDIMNKIARAANQEEKYFSAEQVELILQDFPIFPAAIESVMEEKEQNIKQFYRRELAFRKVHILAIPIMKRMMISKLKRSILPGGMSVGMMDADAIAAQTMQATLNTKHEAGKNTSIMQRLAVLSNTLKGGKTQNPSMTLFFVDRTIDKQECQTFIEKFESITLIDICQDITIENNDLIENWWINIWLELEGISLPKIEDLLLIKLNQQLIYNHKISMQDIVSVLKRELENVIIVPSPIQIGEIYLLPDPDATLELLEKRKIQFDVEYANFIYLDTILLPQIKNFTIKGVDGVETVKVQYRTINSYFISSINVGKNKWRLDFHIYNMQKDSVLISDLQRLLEFLKIKISATFADYFMLEIGEDPFKFINDKVSSDQKKQQQYEEEQQKINAIFLAPDSELIKHNRLYYLQTEGTNLREVFLDENIDAQYSHSNDIREMFSIFGIGIARLVLTTVLADILKSATGSVDPSWVLLQADTICHRGKISGINFTGLEETQSDIMGLISSQRPTQQILKWASVGRYQKFGGVSSQIATGRTPTVGSGSVTITEDKEMIRKLSETGNKLDPDLIKASLAKLKPQATPVARPLNIKKPTPPKPAAIKASLSTLPPTAPLSAQPTLTTRSELLDKAVKPIINMPEIPDNKVISTITRKPKPQSQVFLTSDLPVYPPPSISGFAEPPGLPREIVKLIKEYV